MSVQAWHTSHLSTYTSTPHNMHHIHTYTLDTHSYNIHTPAHTLTQHTLRVTVMHTHSTLSLSPLPLPPLSLSLPHPSQGELQEARQSLIEKLGKSPELDKLVYHLTFVQCMYLTSIYRLESLRYYLQRARMPSTYKLINCG